MPEFITEEQFLALVADRLRETEGVGVDLNNDQVTGNLSDIVSAVLEMVDRHGPVVFGD